MVVESPHFYLTKFLCRVLRSGELFFVSSCHCFACVSGHPEAKDQVQKGNRSFKQFLYHLTVAVMFLSDNIKRWDAPILARVFECNPELAATVPKTSSDAWSWTSLLQSCLDLFQNTQHKSCCCSQMLLTLLLLFFFMDSILVFLFLQGFWPQTPLTLTLPLSCKQHCCSRAQAEVCLRLQWGTPGCSWGWTFFQARFIWVWKLQFLSAFLACQPRYQLREGCCFQLLKFSKNHQTLKCYLLAPLQYFIGLYLGYRSLQHLTFHFCNSNVILFFWCCR